MIDVAMIIVAFVPNANVPSLLGRWQVLQSLFSCFDA
jgi:hypothetical protein